MEIMDNTIAMPSHMDAASMKTQRALFEELAQTPRNFVCDMSNVEFMDSSGVGAIVFLYKRLLGAGCTLEIKGAKGQPLQLLTYLRLDKLLVR